MNPFAWPGGIRCAVFVSVNFDAEVFDLKSTTEDRLYGRFSYGRYGVRAGVPEPQPERGCTVSTMNRSEA